MRKLLSYTCCFTLLLGMLSVSAYAQSPFSDPATLLMQEDTQLLAVALAYTQKYSEDIANKPVRISPEAVGSTTVRAGEATSEAAAYAHRLADRLDARVATLDETARCTEDRPSRRSTCTFADDAVVMGASITKKRSGEAEVEVRWWYDYRGKPVTRVQTLLLRQTPEGDFEVASVLSIAGN